MMVRFVLWGVISLAFAAAILALKWRELRGRGESCAQYLRRAASRLRPLWKPALALFLIYLFAISAILRSNYNYKDDMQRIASGAPGWGYFGRFVSNFSVPFLYGDIYLTDVSPMNQLLAALLMAVAGALLAQIISGEERVTVRAALGAIPLALSPYFLECFSYKFDAVYMAFSVLAAIAPLALIRQRRGVYILCAAFATFLVCTSYQVSLGLFPMLVVLLLLRRWSAGARPRDLGRFLLDSVLGYFGGLIPFKLFVMRTQNYYVSNEMPPLNELFPTILRNYREYFRLVAADFKPVWLVLATLLALAFLWVCARDARRAKPLALLAALAALMGMLLCCFSVYPALRSPLFDPRAMYCVGGLLACLGVCVMSARALAPGKLACLGLSWLFIVFALTYGNALNVQREYLDERVSAVVQDLNDLELDASGGERTLQISGSISLSPAIRRMPQNYQMLNRLLPVSFQGGWVHGVTRLYGFYDLTNIQPGSLEVPQSAHDMPVLKDTMYHTIRGEGDSLLVELK